MRPAQRGNQTISAGAMTRRPVAAPRQAGAGARQAAAGGNGQARLQEVARGSTLNLVGAGVAAVTTLGVTVLVTREFSRAVAGAFFTAISAFLIVEAIASLGANVGLVYFIARLRSLGEERRIPRIMRAAVIPVIVASLALTVIMVLLARPLAHLLLSGGLAHGYAGPAALTEALRALALSLVFAALLDTYLGASRGYRDMRSTVMVDKIGRSTAQMLGILVAVVAGSAGLMAPLWALPYVPAAAAAWLLLRRTQRDPRPRTGVWAGVPPELAALLALSRPVPSKRQAQGGRLARRRLANANPRGFWRFTIPRGIATLASITLQRIDIVLVAIIKGPVDAAVYTAATRFLVAGQLGNMAISMAAQPRFTELFAIDDRRNANVIYQVTTAWLILLTWPLYLCSIVYGPEVLSIFGREYRAGATVMIVLGLTMLLATACGQVDMVLITTGRSSWSLFNGLLTVGTNVGLDLFLIPRYGITGAAIGWAVAIVISNLLPLGQLAATLRMHPIGRGTLVACGLTCLSFGAIPLVMRAVLGHGATALAAGVGCGSVLMVAGLWCFRETLQLSAMPGLSGIIRRLQR
jgi:O-antigen/teichoic acid export membrane protein